MVDNSDRQQIVNMADQDYTYTESLGLALYGDQTPADFRNGHNFNMRELDKDYSIIKNETTQAVENSQKALDYLNGMNVQSVEDGQNLKKQVDENTTRSTASKDQLAALNINSVQDAQNVRDQINTNTESLTSLTAETPAKASILLSRIRQQKKIVLFGDSWTVKDSNLLSQRLGAVANYGVSGATIQRLTAQAQTAAQDTSVDRNTVTHVVVVAGTNNVFHDNNVTEAESMTAFANIKALYPYAECHYFPNNSRTWNDARNHRYLSIAAGAISAGFATHMEFLRVMWEDSFKFYTGTDTYGVQHLTSDGTKYLASRILAVLNGATGMALYGTYNTPIYTREDSNVQASSDSRVRVYYTEDQVLIKAQIMGLSWKEGTTEAQKKKPLIAIGLNNALTGDVSPIALHRSNSPISINGQLYDSRIEYSFGPTEKSSVWYIPLPEKSTAYDFVGFSCCVSGINSSYINI